MDCRGRASRRTCALTLLIVAAGAGSGAAAQTLPNGVASGDVTAHEIVLWTLSLSLGPLEFELARDAAFEHVVRRRTVQVVDPAIPVKTRFAWLAPGTGYHYRATDAAGATDVGFFRTLPRADDSRGVRFGVSGDVAGYQKPYTAVANVAARDLDFFVNMGDTAYADSRTPIGGGARTLAQFRAKHAEIYTEDAWGGNPMAELRAATALFATIDDHEVDNDFAGGAPPASDPRFDDTGEFINETQRFRDAIQAFREYHPLVETDTGWTGDARTAFKPDLYRFRRLGRDAALMLLDARSFRDAPLLSSAGVDLDNPDVGLADLIALLPAYYEPGRTLLGAAQFARLQSDLLRAERLGVTWKFVMIPEPIQNLGLFGAWDHYEGYAAERTELLRFIRDNDIRNVVFVTADIHGTVVNNLAYREGFGEPRIETSAFEISTGAIAYGATFGSVTARIFDALGLAALTGLYDSLQTPGKDWLVHVVMNLQLTLQGDETLGLRGSSIDAQLLEGSYWPMHTRGWTEFEVDRDRVLLVTTYGVDENDASPDAVPRVVSRFRVTPR